MNAAWAALIISNIWLISNKPNAPIVAIVWGVLAIGFGMIETLHP